MAASRQSVANFDAFLKEIYPAYEQELIAANDYPFLSSLRKVDEFGGDAIITPILYGNPAGRSSSYARAWANANTTKHKKFVVTERKTDYNVVEIEAEVMAATEEGDYSFAKAKALEIRGKLEELGKSLSLSLFRDGTGDLGTISSITSGAGTNDVIVLTNKSDVLSVSEGQVLNFRDTSVGTSLIQDSGADARATVTQVDSSAGTITIGGVNLATAYDVAVAAADKILTDGDDTSKVVGLAGWLPLTAPGTSDSFFGVNRSDNVVALSGHRVDNTSRSIVDNGEELALMIGEYGGRPNVWVMNPRAGRQLSQDLGTQVERMDGGNGKFGFNGFELVNWMVPNMTVMFDYTCPPDRAYMLQTDTWKLSHLKGVPHIAQEDGLMIRHSGSTNDSFTCYSRYWAELICRAPGFNGVMSVATS